MLQIVCPEQDPADDNNQQRGGMSDNSGNFLQQLMEDIFFQNEPHQIVHAPKNEIPIGAVPDTGQCPYNAHIKNLTARAASIAAQGDVYIVTEPC